MIVLTIYSGKNCHLCDKMKSIITGLRKDFTFDLKEVDVKSDIELYNRYNQKIPVLFINRKLFAKFSINESRLRDKLSKMQSDI